MNNPIKKFLVVSDFRNGKKIFTKGQTIEFDTLNKAEVQLMAALNHAGRIADCSEENIARLDREMKIEAASAAKAVAVAQPANEEAIESAVKAILESKGITSDNIRKAVTDIVAEEIAKRFPKAK